MPQRTKKVSWGKDVRLARPPLPLQLQLNLTHSQIFHTNKYRHKVYSTQASTRKQKQVEPLHTIHTQTSAHTHTLRKSTSGRWRSPTGDCYKLAGWCRVILPDGESTLGPMGVSGYLWGKLLASSAQWHHRGPSNRKQKSMRAREWECWWNYRIKHLTSLPHFPHRFIYEVSLAWGYNRTGHRLVTSRLNTSLA